jgi:thiamine-phosphate pyrophosphorylase
VCPPPPTREITLCYVTDRKGLGVSPEKQCEALVGRMEIAARAGVDWIQLREKDLPGRSLAELLREALRRVPAGCRIVLNDRLDVACALGAGGVHLGRESLSVEDARRLARGRGATQDFLVGASTHSLAAALSAEKAGADYLVFGPVYATPSKAQYGPPQGIERLREVCHAVSLPVLAIGGITVENARACLEAGAAGIAAIRLFEEASDLPAVVDALRRP